MLQKNIKKEFRIERIKTSIIEIEEKKMKKYGKITGILLSVAVVVLSIIMSTQIPTVNPKITDLPLAIVNQDKNETTATMIEKLKERSTLNDNVSVKWIEVGSKDEAIEKMNNKEYYGAIVIPENYTKSLATLVSSNPQTPEFTVLVNQGMNSQLSTQVSQILTQVVNKSGEMASTQIIKQAEASNKPLPAKVAGNLMNPVKVNVENINSTGDFSTAPSAYFSPIWMSSLVGSIILFMYSRKEANSIKDKAVQKTVQLCILGLVSITIGLLAPYFSEGILGVTVDNYSGIATFLSIATFAFMTIIFGTISLIGLAGVPLAVLLLFFALPLLSLAPEMLNGFYTKWVTPWLPMRMLYDGVKNILFFGQGLWNEATKELTYVAIVGIVLVFTSIFKKEKVKVNK